MKTVLVIGASSSKQSINKTLAKYAASQIADSVADIIDLNDYEMPLYSVDREQASGIPEKAKLFVSKIENADAIVISFAEHNGSYSSAFKNVLDWGSRATKKIWAEKPMFLLATSPGPRGGATVLESAKTYFPYMGANVVASFSLPSFYDNFNLESGLKNEELKHTFEQELSKFR